MTRSAAQEPAEPEEDQSVAARIARALAQRIVTGAIAPGARLRQDHVAAEFGASHVPVREAFRRLEAQGLAESEPRRGVRVPRLEPQAIVEITEMRAALETLALGHAFERIDKVALASARQAIRDGEASDDVAVWEAANRRFHRGLIAPCAMPRLIATIDDLHRASARFLFATWRELNWQQRSEKEHRALLRAVEGRAREEALAILARHIREAGHALVERVRSSASPARR